MVSGYWWPWAKAWAEAYGLWERYTRFSPLSATAMDRIYETEKAKSKSTSEGIDTWCRTHMLIDQNAIEVMSLEYNFQILAILRHVASNPAFKTSIIFQLLVYARLSQRPEFRLKPNRDRERLQASECLSSAAMAKAYFKSVTGLKPNVVTISKFMTERDRIAEQFGGKLMVNYLLGCVHDIEPEDLEESARVWQVIRKCSSDHVIDISRH